MSLKDIREELDAAAGISIPLLLLATVDEVAAGCVALADGLPHIEGSACEMKRLWVGSDVSRNEGWGGGWWRTRSMWAQRERDSKAMYLDTIAGGDAGG